MRGHLGACVAVGIMLCVAGIVQAAPGAVRASFDAADVRLSRTAGFEDVSIDGLESMSSVGEPELPVRIFRFVIPADARVEDVLAEFDEVELPGQHRVAPAQPDVPIGEEPDRAAPDPSVYGGSEPYPSNRVRYLGDGYLGGYRIASVAFYPVQYVPSEGRLVLATDVSVELKLAAGAERAIPRHRMSAQAARLYESVIAGMVDNPSDVTLSRSGAVDIVDDAGDVGFSPRYTPSLEGSLVEYVIITNEALEPYFQPLVDAKTAKGVPATIRTISWIEQNYPGGCDTAERVRMFIQDAYSSWGTVYVLLGGDTNIVPVRKAQTTYYGGALIPCDLYYSDLDGSWNDDGDSFFGEAYRGETAPGDSTDLYPDVFVGRVPARNSVNVQTFLDKTDAYENDPVAEFTDRNLYASEVLFPYDWESGPFSLDGATDITEPGMTYVPAWIHNAKLYQNYTEVPGSHDLSAPAMVDSFDRGYNVVVHVGHGNKDIMRASKDSYLIMADVSELSNGVDRGSFMWLLDCTTTAIDYDCISERFMNNPNGGATGIFGPTRYAFPVTSRDYYWDWLDLLYNQGVTEIGPLCATSKALHASYEESGIDNPDRWTQLATIVLGDPEIPLWTGRPQTLSVESPSSVQVGATGMTITVTDPSPVDSALVCVSKSGDVYARGYTNASGQVTLSFVPHTTGTLTIVASHPGYKPRTVTAGVTAASGAHVYLTSVAVDDDGSGSSDGNGNGRCEAGETVELDVTARNSGTTSASSVTATLTSSDGYVVIEDGTASLGTIGVSATASAPEAFRFHATADAPNEHDATFTVEFSTGSRTTWTEDLDVRIYRPSLRQVRVDLDDSSGNGNGVPETGENVQVNIEVLNDGNGDAGAVTGVLSYPGAGATVTDGNDSWGDLDAGDSAAGSGGFAFTVSGALASHFSLVLSDERGGSWTSYLDFTRPSGPDTVQGTVEGTRINLTWDVTPDADLRGYDVYRAQSQSGPYIQVNDGIIERVAYYSDAGLEENSPYFYYVVAVDSSGNPSPNSTVLSISTNPPSLAGWPLETGGGMYASAACADIDGDDQLEIVIGSEHLYAWHYDGTEVRDGDGDPRTGGIFEIDGVGGYHASAAIGEIDGDPGIEIVAPAWGNVGTDVDPVYEVYAWNGEDGSVLPGWPVTTKKFCWGSPALADLDHDGRSEIVQSCADQKLYCWRYNGSEYIDGDHDPTTQGVFANLHASWIYASPAIADLDGDSNLEIIQPSLNDSIYVFHSDGSRMEGWPFWAMSDPFTSPTVGDVDNDGYPEVVVSSNADKVWLLESDGTVMSGWPKTVSLSDDFSPSPVLADITGDGYLELVLGGHDGSLTVCDYHGDDLPGWPVYMGSQTLSSPAVADIDGDPGLEIVIGAKNGRLYCYDSDGTIVDGWPIQTDAEIHGSPLVADLDGDGDVEVVVGGMDTKLYVWDCDGDYDDGDGVEWGCFLHDPWRTQHYEFLVPVGVEDGGDEWTSMSVLKLYQNSPNPFNPVTTISFNIPAAGGEKPVVLSVYDVAGRRVRTLVDEAMSGGRYGAAWDGRDDAGAQVSSGVYFYRIEVDGMTSAAKKMVLLK